MHTKYYVYILTNKYNKVLYTGVTDNIGKRLIEHQTGFYNGFTKRYNVTKLVYYEEHMEPAKLQNEKSRSKAG